MDKKGGALNPTVTGGKQPSGHKQTSGQVKHARMTTASKVESDSKLPKEK